MSSSVPTAGSSASCTEMVRLLLSLIEGQATSAVILPTELVPRESA